MKFPLPTPPFMPLELSPSQCSEYAQLASALLDETIDEYEHFVHFQRRVLDKKHWKPVKSREDVTVYKQRSSSVAAEAAAKPRANASHSLPKMLAVGSIVGVLDDVMYGIISPDEEAIKVKTQYVNDELVDGRVLYQINYPTERDPFEYLALKWFVKAHPASVNAVVWPRDLVFIEATGYHCLPGGARIGCHLLQSVELPACPELTHLGIQRCQFTSCFLFRARKDAQSVEVYMKSHLEPGGAIPDVVAVMSSANALIGCWKSVWCAQNRKLAWLLRDAAAMRARDHQFQDCVTKVVVHTNPDGKRCCGICTRTLHKLRREITCELCRTAVCSRCRTARKLAFVRRNGDVANVVTAFCKSCVTHAAAVSAADIARLEYVPGALEKRRRRGRVESADAVGAVHPTMPSRRGPLPEPLSEKHAPADVGSVPPVLLLESEFVAENVSIETIDEWEQQQSRDGSTCDTVELHDTAQASSPMAPPTQPLAEAALAQEELWRKMNALWEQAERTYQLTQETNKTFKPSL